MMEVQRTIMTSFSVRRAASLVVVAVLLSALCCSSSVSAAKQKSGSGGPSQKSPRQGKARGGRRWQEGDIRLVGGRRRYEGTVMLLHNGKWGAVCDDMWDDVDANVVCRQNGFPGSARPALKTEFGARAKRRIWITQVKCNGTEDRLLDCAFKGWGVHIRHLCPGPWRAIGVVCRPQNKSGKMARASKSRKAAALKKRNRSNWLARRAKTRAAAAKRKAAMALRRRMRQQKKLAKRRKALKQKAAAAALGKKKATTTVRTGIASERRAFEAKMEVGNKVPIKPWAMHDSVTRTAVKTSSPSTSTTTTTPAATTTTPPPTTATTAATTTTPTTTTTPSTTTTPTTTTTTPTTTTTSTTTTTPTTTSTTPTTTTTTPTTTTTSTTTPTTTTTTATTPTTTTTPPTTTTPSTTTLTETTSVPETTTAPASASTSAAPTTTTRDTIEKSTLATAAGASMVSTETTPAATKKPDAVSKKEKIVDLSKVKSSEGLTLKDKGLERELLLQADSPGNPDLEVRLVGGRYNTEGLLEVRENADQPWGTICGKEWGMRETMVTCRQLGLQYAKQPLQTNYFGGHDKPKMFYSINCTGREPTLTDCTFIRISEEYACPKNTLVAGVVCDDTLPDLIPNLQALEDSVRLQDRPLYYLQCALEENCLSSSAYEVRNNSRTWRNAMRRLLRFSTIVHNRGNADFRPYVNKGQWEWHTCHMHFHSMEVFAHYDILDEDGTRLAEGSKASFCLEDTVCERGVRKQFQCVGFGDQGLSVNCSDNYLWDIDCQWIDISDIKPGYYTFLMEVNPELMVSELDFDNNVARCDLYYSGYFAKFSNCRHESLLDYRR